MLNYCSVFQFYLYTSVKFRNFASWFREAAPSGLNFIQPPLTCSEPLGETADAILQCESEIRIRREQGASSREQGGVDHTDRWLGG